MTDTIPVPLKAKGSERGACWIAGATDPSMSWQRRVG